MAILIGAILQLFIHNAPKLDSNFNETIISVFNLVTIKIIKIWYRTDLSVSSNKPIIVEI
jgi:hypothetical protein